MRLLTQFCILSNHVRDAGRISVVETTTEAQISRDRCLWTSSNNRNATGTASITQLSTDRMATVWKAKIALQIDQPTQLLRL